MQVPLVALLLFVSVAVAGSAPAAGAATAHPDVAARPGPVLRLHLGAGERGAPCSQAPPLPTRASHPCASPSLLHAGPDGSHATLTGLRLRALLLQSAPAPAGAVAKAKVNARFNATAPVEKPAAAGAAKPGAAAPKGPAPPGMGGLLVGLASRASMAQAAIRSSWGAAPSFDAPSLSSPASLAGAYNRSAPKPGPAKPACALC
jgi:hypothetical protein